MARASVTGVAFFAPGTRARFGTGVIEVPLRGHPKLRLALGAARYVRDARDDLADIMSPAFSPCPPTYTAGR